MYLLVHSITIPLKWPNLKGLDDGRLTAPFFAVFRLAPMGRTHSSHMGVTALHGGRNQKEKKISCDKQIRNIVFLYHENPDVF